MTGVLLTGATGKTGRRIAAGLRAIGTPFRAASRHPVGPDAVAFDFDDRSTWAAALDGVDACYLVTPPGSVTDPAEAVIDFAATAIGRGARRFVLLSASVIEPGGPAMGRIHQWLTTCGAEWAVLRPSWFLENFTEARHAASIRERNVILTAAGDGRVAFVSADDIAACAVRLLTTVEPVAADHVLTGPEAVDHDQVAAAISTVTGRRVRHRHVGVEELAASFEADGLPPDAARLVAGMDLLIARGAEDRTTTAVEDLTGHPPRGLDDFVRRNAHSWAAP